MRGAPCFALGLGVIALAAPQLARTDYLADDNLRRVITNKTLKAKTAKDGDAWQVRIDTSGRAEFTFANGTRSRARWHIAGKRIEFVFDRANESSCRTIFVTADQRQEWRDCDTEQVSSYIVEPHFAAVEAAPQTPSSSTDVDGKLSGEAQSLLSKGFNVFQAPVVQNVARGSSMRHSLELQGGTTYAIIATCGGSCSHVSLALRDPNGTTLAQSPEQHHTVIISGPAAQTSKHEVQVTVPGCVESQCAVGLQVLRLSGAPKKK